MFDSKECEWADFSLYINGVFISKIAGFTSRKRQEKEPLHAHGNEPFSIQRGNKTYEGNLVLYKNAVDAINRAVQLAGGDDLLDAEFIIVGSFAPKGTRVIQNRTLLNCEFTEEAVELAQNAKSVQVTLPFIYLRQKNT